MKQEGKELVASSGLAPMIMNRDEQMIAALQNSLYLGAKRESVLMVLSYCAAANLDPMTKPVHIVPMSVKDPVKGEYVWRDVIMPGIGKYRTDAARTKAYAGCTEPEFGPDVTDHIFKGKGGKAGMTVTFPKWCKMTIRRLIGDRVVEFTAKELWLENYATESRDSEVPNAMWRKRPYGQLAKCVEAQCLRKAFPEVGDANTAEEMDGKVIETVETTTGTFAAKNPEVLKALTETVHGFTSSVDLKVWRANNAAQIAEDLSGQGEIFTFNARYAEHLTALEQQEKDREEQEAKAKENGAAEVLAGYLAEIEAIDSEGGLSAWWRSTAGVAKEDVGDDEFKKVSAAWGRRKDHVVKAAKEAQVSKPEEPPMPEEPTGQTTKSTATHTEATPAQKKLLAAIEFVGAEVYAKALVSMDLEPSVEPCNLTDHLCNLLVKEMNRLVDGGSL